MEVSDETTDTNHDLDCDDKENRKEGGKYVYLQYEDFSHKPAGLETYSDGLTHPVEMRRLLTGDLAAEVSVSFRNTGAETFRSLSYPRAAAKRTGEISDPAASASSLFPKPPKLFKPSTSLFTSFPPAGSGWAVEAAPPDPPTHSVLDFISSQRTAFPAVGLGIAGPRKPGRPPTASGSFDPETGSIRYLCRLQCGASLASAKGRRKHEKKHCPNFGKIAPPYIKGQGMTKQQHALALALAQQAQAANPAAAAAAGLNFPHSLFGATGRAGRERKVYDCRYCGKILKTYEGRRLHEKLQHVAKQQREQQQITVAQQPDSKQILIEHLKAAGLDPNILDEDPGKQEDIEEEEEEEEEGQELGVPTIEYGEEEEEEEGFEDEEDTEDPSSDGIEILRN